MKTQFFRSGKRDKWFNEYMHSCTGEQMMLHYLCLINDRPDLDYSEVIDPMHRMHHWLCLKAFDQLEEEITLKMDYNPFVDLTLPLEIATSAFSVSTNVLSLRQKDERADELHQILSCMRDNPCLDKAKAKKAWARFMATAREVFYAKYPDHKPA